MNSTSWPWWQILMQFTQIALRSVVLQVWHRKKSCMGNEVYEEILYRHCPPLTAFSTSSWLLKILFVPRMMGWTPLAKHKPPNLLLNIWLFSKVAVALFVISTPAASPSKIRLRLSTGCDCVDIKTPAWVFRKMSFSSSIPLPPLKMQIPPSLPS